jgi:DNA-binding CsgD family transcriptional regulator
LKNNLKDITSPFIRELETRHQKLTPRELEICNMIKSGYSSRKIAESACISVGAVKLHRNRIRKKLGLIKKKVNLITYLQST